MIFSYLLDRQSTISIAADVEVLARGRHALTRTTTGRIVDEIECQPGDIIGTVFSDQIKIRMVSETVAAVIEWSKDLHAYTVTRHIDFTELKTWQLPLYTHKVSVVLVPEGRPRFVYDVGTLLKHYKGDYYKIIENPTNTIISNARQHGYRYVRADQPDGVVYVREISEIEDTAKYQLVLL